MRTKKKVLQVIDFLHVGGAEKICIQLCNILHKAQYNVTLLILVQEGVMVNSLHANITKIHLRRKHKFNIRTMYSCAKILRNYDIVHVHMRHNYRYLRLVQLLFFVKSTLVFHDHFGNIDCDNSTPFGLATFLKPTYYIGVSKTLTNWAIQKLKMPIDSVFLLPNTVKKEICLKDIEKKGMVLVGNIKPIKNQLFAIQLMEFLDTTLTIYGSIQDPHYFSQLKEEIKKLKLEEKVFFKHSITAVQQELHLYEVGLQTAFSESGPLVLIEYLAQSLPFLTYNTGQVVEDIKSELSNFVLDSFEIKQWLDKLNAIKKTDSTLLDEVYEKYFSEKMYLAKCEAIYAEISKQKK